MDKWGKQRHYFLSAFRVTSSLLSKKTTFTADLHREVASRFLPGALSGVAHLQRVD